MQQDGKRLSPVGGRIVAEVLVGLLEGDPSSYLRVAPAWVPTLAAAQEYLVVVDVIPLTGMELVMCVLYKPHH